MLSPPRRALRLTCLSLAAGTLLVACDPPPEPLSLELATPSSLTAGTQAAGTGAELFEQRCAVCHGAGGAGDGVVADKLTVRPRSLVNAAWQEQATDAHIAAVIRQGGQAHGLSSVMPAFADLNDAQVEALVAHVRSLRPPEKPAALPAVATAPAAAPAEGSP